MAPWERRPTGRGVTVLSPRGYGARLRLAGTAEKLKRLRRERLMQGPAVVVGDEGFDWRQQGAGFREESLVEMDHRVAPPTRAGAPAEVLQDQPHVGG